MEGPVREISGWRRYGTYELRFGRVLVRRKEGMVDFAQWKSVGLNSGMQSDRGEWLMNIDGWMPIEALLGLPREEGQER